MEPQTKRLSMVFYLDVDEHTAQQIREAVEAFVKLNFKVRTEDIESHFRTVNRR